MEMKDLRAKDVAALNKELHDLLRAHFSLRMQKATGQLNRTTLLGEVKRKIARVNTAMKEGAMRQAAKS